MHNKQLAFRVVPSLGVRAGRKFHQTHYWALRQQARIASSPCCGEPGVVIASFGGGAREGVVVVAPLGGGVWCLIRG